MRRLNPLQTKTRKSVRLVTMRKSTEGTVRPHQELGSVRQPSRGGEQPNPLDLLEDFFHNSIGFLRCVRANTVQKNASETEMRYQCPQ